MTTVVGVRFRNTGKAYYYDPADLDLKTGNKVIVETVYGTEIGRIALPPRQVEDSEIVKPLRKVTRLATEEDKKQEIINIEKEKEAYRICRQKIKERGLDMKLVKAEYAFDNKKVLFYFTADGRVDFRELVKDLAAAFKTRIELRQIGVRDETKTLGGIGICGRELCCTSYLNDFAPVSIRMAKEQNLSLNPSKISGVCGRLLCCLKNEQEAYEYLNRKMPKMGEEVITPEGADGEVVSMNILRQTVRVLTEEGDDKEITEFPVDELELTGHRRKKNNNGSSNGGKEGSRSGDGKDSDNKNDAAGGKSQAAAAREKRPPRERGRRNAEPEKKAENTAEICEMRESKSSPEGENTELMPGRTRTRSEMRREAQEARENRRSRQRGERGERRNAERKSSGGTEQAGTAEREKTAQAGPASGQGTDRTRGEEQDRKHEGRRRRHPRGRNRGHGRNGEGSEMKNEGKKE
ncbi:MAG: regulatory iron-sulfur-containing complex subunit RicT [Eubacterium sp.]|nr:regulatory iron-sulfur-containing complex subunit RicT [Eubacterium sp.]